MNDANEKVNEQIGQYPTCRLFAILTQRAMDGPGSPFRADSYQTQTDGKEKHCLLLLTQSMIRFATARYRFRRFLRCQPRPRFFSSFHPFFISQAFSSYLPL